MAFSRSEYQYSLMRLLCCLTGEFIGCIKIFFLPASMNMDNDTSPRINTSLKLSLSMVMVSVVYEIHTKMAQMFIVHFVLQKRGNLYYVQKQNRGMTSITYLETYSLSCHTWYTPNQLYLPLIIRLFCIPLAQAHAAFYWVFTKQYIQLCVKGIVHAVMAYATQF